MRFRIILTLLLLTGMVCIFTFGNVISGTSYVDSSGIHVRLHELRGSDNFGAYWVKKGEKAVLSVKISNGSVKVYVLVNLKPVYSKLFNSSGKTKVVFNRSGICTLKLDGYTKKLNVDLIINNK